MGESTKTALITRMAEYGCKTKIGHTEYWTIQREVSAAKVEDLEAAAKSLIKTIGGCDQLVIGDEIYSCVVLCDADNFSVLEKTFAIRKVDFPYVPGFLAYREAPVIIDAFSKLKNKPDLMMIDGNGILHPRRFGIASHLGVTLNIATIGVAKKLLIGRVEKDKVFVGEELRAIWTLKTSAI